MRYGTAAYSTFEYGTAPITKNLLWGIEVDWDDDGVFNGENEAANAFALSTTRGRDFLVAPSGAGFEPQGVGEAVISLYNKDGRYDPYNTSGPLYGNLMSGKFVKITVKIGNISTMPPPPESQYVFVGVLTNIIPYRKQGTVDLVVVDGWEKLSETDVSASLQEGCRTDEAITNILEAVSWDSMWDTELDVSTDHILYWWEAKGIAKEKLERLAFSSLGEAFIAKDGTFKYLNRHHSTAAVKTLTESELLKDIAIPQPWENTRNMITVMAHPQEVQEFQVLWSLEEQPFIALGDVFEVEAYYSCDNNNVPATGIVAPIVNTDYTGADVQEGIASYGLTFNLDFTDKGTHALYSLENTDPGDGYINIMQVRGYPIAALDLVAKIASAGDYIKHPRRFVFDYMWLQSTRLAKTFADFLADFLSASPIYPQGFIEARPAIQFGLDLRDVVELDLDAHQIDDDFKVGKISHEWLTPTGQLVRTSLKFEPIVAASDYWTIGTSALDTEAKIGW